MRTIRALVTGNQGFIGKNLVKKLETYGLEVIGFDTELYNLLHFTPTLYNLIDRCDVVFHVGAISDTTIQNSGEMLKFNYHYSKIIIDIAAKLNKQVIYSSSAANYGSDNSLPNNIYGWSKLLTEQYGLAKHPRFVALRYFNVYGPGEEHKGKMSSVAYQAYKKGEMQLFPNKPQRDFIYIEDVLEANYRAINAESGYYDVGTAQANTFESLVEGMGIKYTYTSDDKIPSWYQHFTKADPNKWLPGWFPSYNIKKGTKSYKSYLDEKSIN